MTTQQQIDDPGQWRVGDVFEGEQDGHPFSGSIWETDGRLYVGMTTVRLRWGGLPHGVTGHVTRTVEPIPEPTMRHAWVKFGRGTLFRDEYGMWVDVNDFTADGYTWERAVAVYGAPVAVSLPHWSDEVDGLRARVENLAAVFDAEAADFRSANVNLRADLASGYATRLRALLAEGGAA